MTWNNNDNGGAWGAASSAAVGGGSGASIWAGFESLEVSAARAPYIPAGFSGVLEVVELKVISSQKNRGRPLFIASFIERGEGGGEAGRYDWVAKADEESYMRAIKALMCALNPAADPSTFTSAVMERATSSEQPLRGRSVSVRAEEITTRSGNPFTKVHFFAASPGA